MPSLAAEVEVFERPPRLLPRQCGLTLGCVRCIWISGPQAVFNKYQSASTAPDRDERSVAWCTLSLVAPFTDFSKLPPGGPIPAGCGLVLDLGSGKEGVAGSDEV